MQGPSGVCVCGPSGVRRGPLVCVGGGPRVCAGALRCVQGPAGAQQLFLALARVSAPALSSENEAGGG